MTSKSNESQRNNVSSLYRLLESIFDTTDFSVLIKKMHLLNFSKRFLYWIFRRKHFAQIHPIISNILYMDPFLCVGDIKNMLDGNECILYVDDSTIYRSCKIKNINKCSNEIESELNAVETWSKDTILVFNRNKTKVMVIIITTDGEISPTRQFQQSKY